MDSGPELADGNTATVHELDADRVIKRFRAGVDREVAIREYTNTTVAYQAGLPVPEVRELTSIDGNPAIVLDRVEGETMLSVWRRRPWRVRGFARQLADLHATIHAVTAQGLRSYHTRVRDTIQGAEDLEPGVRDRVLDQLDSLADGQALCHGDFHPGNVVIEESAMVIDWVDAAAGPPAADVARTLVVLRFGGNPAGVRARGLRWLFRRWYLRRYTSQTDVAVETIRAWEVPIAAARVTEAGSAVEALVAFLTQRLPAEH